MISTSVINAAVSLLQSKIVVSDERWYDWEAAFIKSLNAGVPGVTFKLGEWLQEKEDYFLILNVKGMKGITKFTLSFVNSAKTGMKYEFSSAYFSKAYGMAKPVANRPTASYFVCYGDIADPKERVGVKVQSSNELIAAVAASVASASPD